MAVSPLPGNPTAVWTVKKAVRQPEGLVRADLDGLKVLLARRRPADIGSDPRLPALQVSDEFDAYIVVSFSNATLVLR